MKKPVVITLFAIEGEDGNPRQAQTKAERRAIDEAIMLTDDDRLTTLAWCKDVIPKFQAMAAEKEEIFRQVGEVLLKHALAAQKAASDYAPGYLADLVQTMIAHEQIIEAIRKLAPDPEILKAANLRNMRQGTANRIAKLREVLAEISSRHRTVTDIQRHFSSSLLARKYLLETPSRATIWRNMPKRKNVQK